MDDSTSQQDSKRRASILLQTIETPDCVNGPFDNFTQISDAQEIMARVSAEDKLMLHETLKYFLNGEKIRAMSAFKMLSEQTKQEVTQFIFDKKLATRLTEGPFARVQTPDLNQIRTLRREDITAFPSLPGAGDLGTGPLGTVSPLRSN